MAGLDIRRIRCRGCGKRVSLWVKSTAYEHKLCARCLDDKFQNPTLAEVLRNEMSKV